MRNNIPKNNFVLKIAKISRALDTFTAKICIIKNTVVIKTSKISSENVPVVEIMIKNQNVSPAETVNALNRGDESSILDRINKCD